MRASDIMTTDVATVPPDLSVQKIAQLMSDRRVSGVPVVAPGQGVLGMVSEADLLRRVEMGTDSDSARWRDVYAQPEKMAQAFVKSHGAQAHDIMARPVISVEHDAELQTVANTLDQHGIKRVPVMRDGKLVGVIARSDLVRAFGTTHAAGEGRAHLSSGMVHKAITDAMDGKPWLDSSYLNVSVTGGVVRISGFVQSKDHQEAIRLMIEQVPGVERIEQDIEIGMPSLSWDGQLMRDHMLK